MPTALSIRDASCPHWLWRTAPRSVRSWPFGVISKRLIRRSSPKDKALVTMWERRAELEGFAAVMEGVRNASERLKGRAIAGPYDYDQIPALVERSRLRVKNFYADLDARLSALPFIAGDYFSAADITGLVTADFATKAMSFPVPDEHKALRRWFEKVSSRPSAAV